MNTQTLTPYIINKESISGLHFSSQDVLVLANEIKERKNVLPNGKPTR